jgi:G:T-mismatch repair DNA endonuclease (very short patch repair protein)
MPAVNRKYWQAKIDDNKVRDKAVNSELRRQGWRVIRFWEYDIKHRFNKVLSILLSEIENAETAD